MIIVVLVLDGLLMGFTLLATLLAQPGLAAISCAGWVALSRALAQRLLTPSRLRSTGSSTAATTGILPTRHTFS